MGLEVVVEVVVVEVEVVVGMVVVVVVAGVCWVRSRLKRWGGARGAR